MRIATTMASIHHEKYHRGISGRNRAVEELFR